MSKKLGLILFILLVMGLSSFSRAEKKTSITPKPPKGAGQIIVRSLWSQALPSGKSKKKYFPEMASPALDGGELYVGTHSGLFYAIDALVDKGHKTLWRYDSHGPIASQPLVHSDFVIFGNNKGDVTALNRSNGTLKWKLFVGGEVLARPVDVGTTVYVVNTSREVSAINIETGELRWSTYVKGFEKKVTMRGNAPVVLAGDHLFVGFADGQVVSLTPEGGGIIWSKNFADPDVPFWDVDSAFLVDHGVLYVAGYSGSLMALSSSSGQILWKAPVKSGSDMVMDENFIYLSSVDGQVVAYDKKNGKRLWQSPLNSGAMSSPLVMGNYLMIGTQQDWGFVLDKQNGKVLQKFSIPGGFLGNGVTDNSFLGPEPSRRVYFLSGGGTLRAFSLSSQPKKN